DLLAVELDEVAPPFLEAEKARPFGVDGLVDGVQLAEQRVAGVQAVEIGDQVRAVELAVAEVAREGREPGAAKQPPSVAHRILAVHALPVGDRRAWHQYGAEQVG